MSEPVSLSSDTQISRSSQSGDAGALRTLIVGILLVVLLSSLSINVLLYKQYHEMSDSLRAKQAQVAQLEAAFNERQKPIIDSLVGALSVFAKTSPDFAPILAKYRVAPGSESAASASTNAAPKH